MTANVVHPAELERMLQARVEEVRSGRTARRRRPIADPPRRRRRGSLALVAGTLLALAAATVYGVVSTANVEVTGRTGYAADKTDEGGIVEYIGDQHTTFGSSGSGIFDAFVRIQADDNERGYNTDGDLEFDTKGGNFTHSIKVSEIPIVPCESLDGSETGTGLCWELFADLNESDSTKNISLDDFEIYFTTDDELTDYNAAWGAPVYASDDRVLINDVNQGSGRGDLRYLVPITGITMPSNCDYGNAACATFFVLYSAYGDVEDFDGTPGTSTYDSDGGFEEWKVKRYPFLDVEKTATTTFTRTFGWTIEKSADPATWDLFDGDTGTSDWTVAVTKDAGTDSAWAVSGTITIENPSEQDAVIASVTDVISGVGSVTPNCGVTFPHELDEGDSLVCTYSSSLPNGTSRTNTATATLADGPVFADDAAVTFGSPTTLVNDTVDVTDTNGMSWNDVSDDFSDTYDETFACGADEGTHTNTATITQTGQSDSATVTVTCYDLDVTKTATPSFSRDFDWTIEKSVDPTSLDLFDGDSDDVTWTVRWTKSAADDFGYAVSGQITIDNNHPTLGAVINSVSDVITTSITATVDCGEGVTFPHTIAAGESLVCGYSSTLPDGATRTNTATATQQNFAYASDLGSTASTTTNYSGTASVNFTGVNPTVTDDTATLSDERPGNTIDGDVVSASGSASWDETFECGADEGTETNLAIVTEDDSGEDDDDDASVTINCYQLTVTKDAATTYSRDYDWSIEKTRFIAEGEDDGDGDPLTLTLDEGQTYTASYEITVTMTGFTDDDHAVSGTITVSNPAPIDAVDVVVTDLISPDIAADVDCDGDNTITIPAEDSVQCSYSADLPNSTSRTNTATATLFEIDYTGTAGVTFDLDNPTTEIDECIDIVDDAGTPSVGTDDVIFGTVCVDDLDGNDQWSDEYTLDIGPFAVCGPATFTNAVIFATTADGNDTDESGSDTYTVNVDVPCPQGCTLTQGYWKTHNDSFWGGAPTDETWQLLGDVDGDGTVEGERELFFKSGLTYFEVMWTAPKGNAYFNLATQYIAAQLNMLDGADGSAITTAFNAATTLFQTYTDEEIGALKGKNGNALRAQFISLAGTLASYNEGLIGPGHCDEDAESGSTAGTTQFIADRRAGPNIG